MPHLQQHVIVEKKIYKMELVKPEDTEEIIELLCLHYLSDTPMLKCVENKPCQFMLDRIKFIINEGYSCKAVHIETGAIIGVALNRILTKENINIDYNQCKNSNLLSVLKFIEYFKSSKYSIFKEHPRCKHIFDTEIIAVSSEYRQLKIATELIVKTLEIGQKHNIHTYQCICDNIYFGKVCAREGYTQMYICSIKNYCVLNELPVSPSEPHSILTYYVKTTCN